jgi:ATP-binding cassette subfamily B protein/subfamily B ATP-binding cassette protein MsbA
LGSAGIHYGLIVRLNEILNDRDKEFLPQDGLECKNWEKEIQFKHVSLQYPNTSRPALCDISFVIPKSATVAFVGLSGAGKSSILDLILGLREPLEGEIVVDGQPLSSFSQESWRRRIGVVSQDTFIFNETIEENIRFGDLESSHEKLVAVATSAGASEFIEYLPDGYQTVVGERGHKLSGGERQRIALARALLRNPEILILDEATSSLDSFSEQLIQKSLDLMQNNKTMIIVAHRLSTIVDADQIYVIEQGKIIEAGRHEELLFFHGRYAQLWDFQSNKSANKPVRTPGVLIF